jgi:hypothetical protein
LISFIELYAEVDKIYTNGDESQLIFKLFNSKSKYRLSFILSRILCNSLNNKVNLCDESSLRLIYQKEKNESANNFVMDFEKNIPSNVLMNNNNIINSKDLAIDEGIKINSNFLSNNNFAFPNINSNSTTNLSNKENINFLKIKSANKKGSKTNTHHANYKIIYDQNYSGIKKRNTSDEERKKYIISIPNIINEKDLRTTLMIKNIPNNITQSTFITKLNKNYSSAYNFFYLPIDFNKKANAGYAFINFKTSKFIVNFFLELDNKPWDFPGAMGKICYLSYARIQGFRSICDHFQKSNIMKQVDEKIKPIIILD